ncbi:MAG: cytochrome b/b6 domain-containing protein [Planctomycetes bacterium]|nr:cytochrome b/b6 domain-containing protein [Planctomycetota bacterium]
MPNTCRSCHTNVDLVKKHINLREKPIEMYEGSVHGRATGNVLHGAAACQDCHAAADAKGHQTAHRILSPSDPQSTTNHFNIPGTCGKCHAEIARQYGESTHGQYAARGESDAPVCTNCHGEHGIVSPKDASSPVNAMNVAQETCAPCHESELLNEKYGLPGGRLASYIDSYHGLKSKAGDVRVANCASCHGAHRILPSSDARSSIHPDNLPVTCGKCHPGIGAGLAQAKIHRSEKGLRSTWAGIFRIFYLVLIFATIGFMLLHNGADWLRAVRQMKSVTYVRRLSANETAQHWVLAISFTVLVISGFSLRFSEAAWVKFLFGWKGGFVARGIIHRVAAVVMIVGALWHMLYWFTRDGRTWLRDMWAAKADVRHFRENIAYFLGRRQHAPRFGRFSYMEKMEYWALIWGTIVMVATGTMLWFDNLFIDQWGIPKGFLDVMLVIHYYEAWLAFLAIVVWHLYGTLFKPGVYPMNPAWITGKMPKSMYLHEHADGPHLRSHVPGSSTDEVVASMQPKPAMAQTIAEKSTSRRVADGGVELVETGVSDGT